MMAEPDKRLEQMLIKLRENDLRITPQRLAVLKILAKSKGHPTVERIYDQVRIDFPTTSLATVYKCIVMMKNLGEVLEIGFSDDSNRYDGRRPHPHPHLICNCCKRILDPDLASLKAMTLELSKETGYRIESHRLDFFGVCPECQSKGK
jgi:Fur family peroxide stress response transcriptional regulator